MANEIHDGAQNQQNEEDRHERVGVHGHKLLGGHDMIVTVDLTRREADELLRAELVGGWHRSSESDGCIARELESAAVKLCAAIDRASRE